MIFSIRSIEDKKEFTFCGDRLVQKECVDKERHIYVYERYDIYNRLCAYEVVMGVKRTDPVTGEIKYTYPNTEQFGSFGYYVSAKCKDRVQIYIKRLQDKRNIEL